MGNVWHLSFLYILFIEQIVTVVLLKFISARRTRFFPQKVYFPDSIFSFTSVLFLRVVPTVCSWRLTDSKENRNKNCLPCVILSINAVKIRFGGFVPSFYSVKQYLNAASDPLLQNWCLDNFFHILSLCHSFLCAYGFVFFEFFVVDIITFFFFQCIKCFLTSMLNLWNPVVFPNLAL